MNQIVDAEHAVNILRESIDFTREQVILIGVNTKNKVMFSKIVFLGGISYCLIDFRIIFRELLLNSCTGFVLGHNHPSGDLTPSQEDIETYEKLNKLAEDLGFRFLVIFSESDFYSFFEEEEETKSTHSH